MKSAALPKNRLLVAAALFGGLFLVMLIAVQLGWLNQFDTAIINWVYGLRRPTLTDIMLIVTSLGGGEFLTVVCLGLCIWAYSRERLFHWIVASLGGGAVLVELLKIIVERPRPESALYHESGFSFPSGHAMLGLIVYSLLAHLAISSPKNHSHKWDIIALAILTIGLIGFSRVYLGVHYPSDVIAGYLAGGAWLIAAVILRPKI